MKLFNTKFIALLAIFATWCIGADAQRTNWEKLLRDLNSNSKSNGRELVVTLREPGELAKKLTPQDCERVSFLRVNGRMDKNDMKLLTELAKRKETMSRDGKMIPARIDLDLQNARIVEPGTFMAPPRDITVMPDAFRSCTGLRSIILPNNLTEIGAYAFASCSNLEYVYIPDYVRAIGTYAFNSNTRLTQIDMPNGIEFIGDNAFASCSAIQAINLPLGLVKIGRNAFYSSGLRYIEIPDMVESIGQNAFHGVYFKEFIVSPNNRTYSSHDGVLYTKDMSTVLRCPEAKTGSHIIPDGTRSIAVDAFYNCHMNSVVLPPSCTNIGSGAFAYCSIGSFVVPEGVTTIQANTFEECGNLKSITFPSTLTAINKEAFRGCRNLLRLDLPASLTSIGEEAFRACKGLTEIVIPENVQLVGEKAFYYCVDAKTIKMLGSVPPVTKKPSNENKKVTLLVPAGSKQAYASANGWKDIKKIEEQ